MHTRTPPILLRHETPILLTMTRRLRNSWAKLSRADEHINALYDEFDRLIGHEAHPGPLEIATHFEAEPPAYLIVVSNVVDLSHTGLVLGDALQNLRAALDHMVAQLAEEANEPVTKDHQFPFVGPSADWRSVVGQRLKGLREAEIAVIELYQPKVRGNGTDRHPFAFLADLTNKDKHRLVIPALMFPNEMRIRPHVTGAAIVEQIPLYRRHQPLEVGTELMRVRLAKVTERRAANMEGVATVYPAFDDGERIKDRLMTIRQYVVNVLSQIEALPPRS